MLRRNGENCEHTVPNYPGLLTDSEHKAYVEVTEYVKAEIEHCNYREKMIGEIEKQIPRLKQLADKAVPENVRTFTFRDDKTWNIIDTFYKEADLWELYFCSLKTPTERMFGIIERLYPKSGRVTELFGKTLDSYYLARGKNPSLVLNEFLDNQRFIFETTQKKLEVMIAEDLFKRHSAAICRRVCKAVATLYSEQMAIKNAQAPTEKESTGVKIKL
jgi:hypothetical protein